MADVYAEVLRLAGGIRDPYLRAVTYARLGYRMHRDGVPLYRKAFSRALRALTAIEEPLQLVRGLLEVGGYLGRVSPAAKKTFIEAHEAIQDFPQPIRDELMAELVFKLLELGWTDDAFFYAQEIERNRDDVLKAVLRQYLRKGNMRRAHIILGLLEDKSAAYDVLMEHLRRQEFGSALKLLPELEGEELVRAMKAIAAELKRADVPRDTYDRFLEVVLSTSPLGTEALASFLAGLAAQGEVDYVIGALARVDEGRERVIGAIVSELEGDGLRKFLRALPAGDRKVAARFILDRLLDELDPSYRDLARELALDERLAVKAVRYLSKLRAYDDAWELASRIKNPYLRSLAFGSIAVEKLKENDVGGAIDAALEVKDPRWGEWLLSEILVKALDVGKRTLKEDIEERAERQRRLWGEG